MTVHATLAVTPVEILLAVTPVEILLAYIRRIVTVQTHTLSIGPFILRETAGSPTTVA